MPANSNKSFERDGNSPPSKKHSPYSVAGIVQNVLLITTLGLLVGALIMIFYLFEEMNHDELLTVSPFRFHRDEGHTFVVLIYSHCVLTGWKQCSGSVISKHHVLTAAHCIICNMTEENATLRVVDDIKIMTRGYRGLYDKFKTQYYLNTYQYFPNIKDGVAIIELDSGSFEFDVRPVTLVYDDQSIKFLNLENSFTALGYGVPQIPDDNNKLNLTEEKLLRNHLIHGFSLNASTITNGEAHKMEWYGDGGGPVIVKPVSQFVIYTGLNYYYQTGLIIGQSLNETKVEFNNTGNIQNLINGFVAISSYCDFIQSYTNSETKCQ